MRLTTTVLLALLLLAGCKNGTGIKTGFEKPAASSSKARGTNGRAQKWMQTSIDLDLAREKRGERPGSGKRTWREYWEWRISVWRQEKQSKQYEQYLSHRRKDLGLPPVKKL